LFLIEGTRLYELKIPKPNFNWCGII